MPQRHLRTRSKKRLNVALPSGKNRVHYRRKIPSIHPCSVCGRLLHGISHLTDAEKMKLNRSKRRIWRPYGGQICHKCLRKTIKQASRIL